MKMWYMVKFEIPQMPGQVLASRVFDESERDKLIDMLPSIGATFMGFDILMAGDATGAIENIKKQFDIKVTIDGENVVELKRK